MEQNALFRQTCVAMGVPVSWFQSKVNARWHVNWRKYGSPTFDLPNTDEVLRFAYDLKMPPYFDDEDFPAFAKVINLTILRGRNPEAVGGETVAVFMLVPNENGDPAAKGARESQKVEAAAIKLDKEAEERREKIAAELKAQEDEKRAKYKEKIEKAKAKARAKPKAAASPHPAPTRSPRAKAAAPWVTCPWPTPSTLAWLSPS